MGMKECGGSETSSKGPGTLTVTIENNTKVREYLESIEYSVAELSDVGDGLNVTLRNLTCTSVSAAGLNVTFFAQAPVRRDQRRAPLAVARIGKARHQVSLGIDDRKRRAQLVRGAGHEL